MENKYAATFETGGIEAFCLIKPGCWVGTLEDIRRFIDESKGSYITYHIYRLVSLEKELSDEEISI